MPLDLVTIPCLSDNYTYLLHDPATGATAVIDVPEVAPVKAALDARGWTLTDIFITHHHNDHVGGVDELRKITGARVTGAAADDHRLPNLDTAVVPGDTILLGELPVKILDAGGHTVGHIAYFFPDDAILCSGDSLMALGCGRLFEGTPDQMWDTLSRFMELPDQTRICSGHEYTQANAKFALTIEPDNQDLLERAREIDAARREDKPTVPSVLEIERATNPFLRASDPGVKASLHMENQPDAQVFAQIRRMKDAF